MSLFLSIKCETKTHNTERKRSKRPKNFAYNTSEYKNKKQAFQPFMSQNRCLDTKYIAKTK